MLRDAEHRRDGQHVARRAQLERLSVKGIHLQLHVSSLLKLLMSAVYHSELAYVLGRTGDQEILENINEILNCKKSYPNYGIGIKNQSILYS